MSVPTPPAPKGRGREFDQVLRGDVKIKKIPNSNKEYKITFSKKNISKVFNVSSLVFNFCRVKW